MTTTATKLAAELEDDAHWAESEAKEQWFKACAAELRRLDAEVEALRKDAERYRWLRAAANTTADIDIGAGFEISDTLDAAIDAAMKGAANG